MRLEVKHDIHIIIALVGAFLAVELRFPHPWLLVVVGVPFAIFIPGYSLLLAALPGSGAISTLERLLLSLALSMGVIGPLGYLVNLSPLRFELRVMAPAVAVTVLALAVVGWWRRRRLEPERRYVLSIQVPFPHSLRQGWLGRCLLGGVGVAMLLTPVLVVLNFVAPLQKEAFTEFYITDPLGRVAYLPARMVPGKGGSVTAIINNQEQRRVEYYVQVRANERALNTVGPVVLEHGQRGRAWVPFTLWEKGLRQKVEFVLFADGLERPYFPRPLFMWVDVTDIESSVRSADGTLLPYPIVITQGGSFGGFVWLENYGQEAASFRLHIWFGGQMREEIEGIELTPGQRRVIPFTIDLGDEPGTWGVHLSTDFELYPEPFEAGLTQQFFSQSLRIWVNVLKPEETP